MDEASKATGGFIAPDADIRVQLHAGETIISAAAVRRLGRDFLKRLNGEELDVD